ncbi:MAG: hypothetical protein QM696_02080 [Steroidobacteraceae bacterium]
MKAFTGLVVCALLFGCAADPAKRAGVAQEEAVRLASPSEPLANFGKFELLPMTFAPEVMAKPEKVEAARAVETAVREQLTPLLDGWRSKAAAGNSRTLSIQPRMMAVKITSGGARFWAGAMAGESQINMQLILTEKETGKLLAQPNVQRTAGAMAGAWSIGKSDKNLMLYIADITRKYLEDSYRPAAQ